MKYLKKFNEDYDEQPSCNIQSGGNGRYIIGGSVNGKIPKEPFWKKSKETTYELTSLYFVMTLTGIKTEEEAIEQLKYWRVKNNNPELKLKVIKNGKHHTLWNV